MRDATLQTSVPVLLVLLSAAISSLDQSDEFRVATMKRGGSNVARLVFPVETHVETLFEAVHDLRQALAATSGSMTQIETDVAECWAAILARRASAPWDGGFAIMAHTAQSMGLELPEERAGTQSAAIARIDDRYVGRLTQAA